MKKITTALFALVAMTAAAQNNFTISGDYSIIENFFMTPRRWSPYISIMTPQRICRWGRDRKNMS